jgi:hypothetical protein
MGKVERIEQQIQDLSAEELVRLRVWFAAFDAEAWDRQFEADVNAGETRRAWPASAQRPWRRQNKKALNHHASPEFWQSYRSLPASIQQLKRDARHPSLHFKKVGRFYLARFGLHHRSVGTEAQMGL